MYCNVLVNGKKFLNASGQFRAPSTRFPTLSLHAADPKGSIPRRTVYSPRILKESNQKVTAKWFSPSY